MKQPPGPIQNFSSADNIKIIVVIIFLGILLVILGFLIGLLLRQRESQFSHRASSRPLATPTVSIPTEHCDSSTLVLGTTTFQIQDVTSAPDGSLAVPADTSGIAYRVEGTGTNPVFVLSPTPQNITVMSTISVGSPAKFTSSNCDSITYRLSAPQAGALDRSILVNQSVTGITIFFPTVSSGVGFVYKGQVIDD